MIFGINNKFKNGDKVKIIGNNEYNDLKVGEIGIIIDAHNGLFGMYSDVKVVKKNKSKVGSMAEEDLELIETEIHILRNIDKKLDKILGGTK